jgi:riboflavin kinase/FMN adenylyltransferase
MRLVRDLEQVGLCPQGSAATIGNFDGMHRGHLALLNQAHQHADQHGLATAVISFDPLAREHFAPEKAPPRIYNASERVRLMRNLDVDLLWLMRFGPELASVSAEAFVQRFLVDGLAAQRVIVGDDFRFGKDRSGDFSLLQSMGRQLGFAVVRAEKVSCRGERVSSTRVRQALQDADFELSGELLGRPYCMFGRVVRGLQLGRKLGFPTANIRLHRRASPIHGIYAVRVSGAGLDNHSAVSSVGIRPTVDGKEMLLEVHLFDYDGDLYGRHLDVEFIKKLRDEERFDSLEAMTTQIRIDAEQARELLAA